MTAAVFFDATGTLLGPERSVGSVYKEFIERFGLAEHAEADRLEQSFAKSLRQAEPLAFPDASEKDLPRLEKQWWRRRVQQTVGGLGLDRSALFEPFFEAVFAFYAQHYAWHLMPGCRQALSRLATRKFHLAVVSNFDSRLPDLLQGLGIAGFFDAVVYSSRAGAAKPDERIFRLALQRIGVPPQAALHVGDSLEQDVQGARSAGLKAALYDPHRKYSLENGIDRIESLTAIPGLLL